MQQPDAGRTHSGAALFLRLQNHGAGMRLRGEVDLIAPASAAAATVSCLKIGLAQGGKLGVNVAVHENRKK